MASFTFSPPQLHRLYSLLQQVRERLICVPRFQRPVVWHTERRLLLLDSVYNGYPIGSIFLWNMPVGSAKASFPTYENIGPLLLPKMTKEAVQPGYLLDGHQRIATLFGFFGLALYSTAEQNGAWDPQAERSGWEGVFDLDAQSPEGRFLLVRPEECVAARHVQLSVILNPYRLAGEQRRLIELGRTEEDVLKLQGLADRVRETMIPVVYLATDDLSIVTMAYKRVNSESTPMSELHMVKALAWTKGIDIEQMVTDKANELPLIRWRPFAREWMLDTCKLLLGLTVYDADEQEIADKIAKQPEALDEATAVISRGAELLRNVGVIGPGCVPYALQVIIIGLECKDSSPETIDQVRRWFWASTLTSTFKGAFDATIRRAREHLRSFLSGGNSQPLPEDKRPVSQVRFEFRSARTRGQCLLLARQLEGGAWNGNAFTELDRAGVDATVRPLTRPKAPSMEVKRAWESIASRVVAVSKAHVIEMLKVGAEDDQLNRYLFNRESVKLFQENNIGELLQARQRRFQDLEFQLNTELGLELEFVDRDEEP